MLKMELGYRFRWHVVNNLVRNVAYNFIKFPIYSNTERVCYDPQSLSKFVIVLNKRLPTTAAVPIWVFVKQFSSATSLDLVVVLLQLRRRWVEADLSYW